MKILSMKIFLKEKVSGNIKLTGFEMKVVKIIKVYKSFGDHSILKHFLQDRKCGPDG